MAIAINNTAIALASDAFPNRLATQLRFCGITLRHCVRCDPGPKEWRHFDLAIVVCEELLFRGQRCKVLRALNARDQMRVNLLAIGWRQLTVQILFQQAH